VLLSRRRSRWTVVPSNRSTARLLTRSAAPSYRSRSLVADRRHDGRTSVFGYVYESARWRGIGRRPAVAGGFSDAADHLSVKDQLEILSSRRPPLRTCPRTRPAFDGSVGTAPHHGFARRSRSVTRPRGAVGRRRVPEGGPLGRSHIALRKLLVSKQGLAIESARTSPAVAAAPLGLEGVHAWSRPGTGVCTRLATAITG